MQFNSIKSYLYSAKCNLKALQRYNPIRVQFITFKIHTYRSRQEQTVIMGFGGVAAGGKLQRSVLDYNSASWSQPWVVMFLDD